MSATTTRRKPAGKAPARAPIVEDEPSSSRGHSDPFPTEESTPARRTDTTSSGQTLTPLPQESANARQEADLRTQLNRSVSNTLGAPVQLTDEQFRVLIERLAAVGPDTNIPTTERPFIS